MIRRNPLSSIKQFVRGKPLISIEDFCRRYYAIVAPWVDGTEDDYCALLLKHICELDQSCTSIDPSVFQREMKALQMELFELAFMHQFGEFSMLYVKREAVFTKSYLEEKGKSEIWHIMSHYNQAIADSQIEHSAKSLRRRGKDFEPLASVESIREGSANFYRGLRADMCNKWVEEGLDWECAVRIANRFGPETHLSEHPVLEMLVDTLGEQLGEQLKTHVRFELHETVIRLYKLAKDTIKSVKNQIRVEIPMDAWTD